MTTENIFAGQSARIIRDMVASDPALAPAALAHYQNLLATRKNGLRAPSLDYAYELAFGEKPAQTEGWMDDAAARVAAYKPTKRAKARKPQTEAKPAPAAPQDALVGKALEALDKTMASARDDFAANLIALI